MPEGLSHALRSAVPKALTARPSKWSRTGVLLAASAAALAATAVYNTYRARKAERHHPPGGRFVTVDGVRLHYIEKGEGPPVVLIHGNIVNADDYALSGVLDRLAGRHRVIAFDRPGFGYSERPHDRLWTAAAQADLLHRAVARLGIERPVIVGHSWGTLVALEMALADPDSVRGLVLLAGYYSPTLRADMLLVAPVAIPVVGDVMRYTVSPLLGAATLPLMLKAMFAPLSIPDRFAAGFAQELAVRPWQIRAESQDGATMATAAMSLQDRYRDLSVPVAIIAGTEDKIVDVGRQSSWLHGEIPNSSLRLVPGAGHMVHHAVPGQVAAAVEAVSGGRRNGE